MDERRSRQINELKVSLQELLAEHHRDLECAIAAAAPPPRPRASCAQTRLPQPPSKQVGVANGNSTIVSRPAQPKVNVGDSSGDGAAGPPEGEGASAPTIQQHRTRWSSQSSRTSVSSVQGVATIGQSALDKQGAFARLEEHHIDNLGEAFVPETTELSVDELVEKELVCAVNAVDNAFEHIVEPEVTLNEPSIEAEDKVARSLLMLTESSAFHGFVAVAIFVNSILLGVIVHIDLMRAFRLEGVVEWEATVENVFMIIFTTEVFLRVAAERCVFFHGSHWRWNVFDFVVVMTTLLEYLAAGLNAGALRSLRVLRMLRVMRVMRLMRFLRELRMMVCAILCSGASLFWAAMLIMLSVYLFSVFLGEVLRTHLREAAVDSDERQLLMTYYDGVLQTMLMLVVALMGGNDWFDVAMPVMNIDPAYGLFFIIFVCFVTLGMLNVLTGIFVESASNISGMDAELVMAMELKEKDSRLAGLRRLFKELDNDGSMSLSWNELLSHLEDERVVMHFTELDITTFHATRLFQLLDTDASQVVGIDEFIDGCMRFRGVGKAIDLASMIYDKQRTDRRLSLSIGAIGDATVEQGKMLKDLYDRLIVD